MDVWKANEDVRGVAVDLIANYHPHLAVYIDQIAIVFREKAAKAGGQVVLGKSKKATILLGVLGDVDYKFIIELAADEWSRLTSDEQKALIDHHLCACRVDEDAKTGNVKFYIAPPDFVGYRGEIERHGIWRPDPSAEEPGASPIEQLFSKGGDSE